MPRPVDALPCGSISIRSVGWPMAASAVPRLIAVVVLPTPPFWLATTSVRGPRDCGSIGMAKLPDREDDAGRIGATRLLPHLHPPRFMGFGQFFPYRLTLEKKIQCVRTLKSLCIDKQPRQRRTSPGGNDVERLAGRVLHARIAYLNVQSESVSGQREKVAFLAGGLDEHGAEAGAIAGKKRED